MNKKASTTYEPLHPFILGLMFFILLVPSAYASSWWNIDWGYRMPITISNPGNPLNDYQVLISNIILDETGLVGSWHFDEGSGTMTADASGNMNYGRLINGPVWVDGKYGKALQFDGIDDYVTGTTTGFPTGSNAISMFAWIKTTTTNQGTIIYYGSGNPNRLASMNIAPNGEFYVSFQSNDAYSGIAVNDGKWHFVGFSLPAGSTTITLVVDGTIVSKTLSSVPSIDANTNYRIGMGPGFIRFNGIIDEVRIYNRTLNESEIRTLYQAKVKPNYDDIRFIDSDGTTKLNYWKESDGKFWVRIPSIPSGSKTIYVYYNNPNAVSESNGTNTFLIYDDFERTNLDKWSIITGGGTASIVNELNMRALQLYAHASSGRVRYNAQTFIDDGQGYKITYKQKWTREGGYGLRSWVELSNIPGVPIIYAEGSSGTYSATRLGGAGFYENNDKRYSGPYFFQNTIYNMIFIRNATSLYWSIDGGKTAFLQQSGTAQTVLGDISLEISTWDAGNTLLIDDIRVQKYASPEPIASPTGIEETYRPTISLFSPSNITYVGSTSITVPINFTVYGLFAIYSIEILENGIPVYQNTTYQNNTNIAINRTFSVSADMINVTIKVIEPTYNVETSKSIIFSTKLFDSSYRKPITIQERSGKNLTDYPIKLIIPYENGMQSDFDDLRFSYLNQYGAEEYVYYWIQNKIDNQNATVWIKVPYIPADGTSTIYMYFGNLNAISESNSYNTGADPIENLVLYMPLDEGSGNTIYDMSPSNNTGNISNAIWVDGKWGKALYFNGNPDNYAVISNKNLSGMSAITIANWVNIKSFPTQWVPIGPHGSAGAVSNRYGLHWNTNNHFRPHINEYGPDLSYSPGLQLNRWYHVVMVYNGSTFFIYLNGTLVAQGGTASGIVNPINRLTIGRIWLYDDGWKDNWYLNGTIDELRIYNKALTAEEISILYNAPFSGTIAPKSPVSYMQARAILNPDKTISIENSTKRLPARWRFQWNQTDNMLANRKYKRIVNITFDNNYIFSSGEIFYNITEWVYNSTPVSNYNIIFNSTSLPTQQPLLIQHDIFDERIPITMSILPGRRQDFSKNTSVDGAAYSIFEVNITNNASAEDAPANFTNVRILSSCNDYNCTGFTRMIELAENEMGWSNIADANIPTLSSMRRESFASLNISFDASKTTSTYAQLYKLPTGHGNLSAFSNGNMSLWLYVANKSMFSSISFGIGTDASNKKLWQYPADLLNNGWNYIFINLSKPADSAVGSINWSNINYLEIFIDGTSGASFVLLDDWRIWSHNITETINLNTNESRLFWLMGSKDGAIKSVSGGAGDWIQDTSKTSYAGTGGVVWIKGNIMVNNTDNIKYENVTFLPTTTQSRTGWNCIQQQIEIYAINPNEVLSSTVWPISCNKTGVITIIGNTDWRQDTSKQSTAGLDAYIFIEGNQILNNTDTLSYSNISINIADFSGRSGWECTFNTSRNIGINIQPNGQNTTLNYPVQCKKKGMIQAISSGSWAQDTSKQTQAGGNAYVKGRLSLVNLDSLSYTNVRIDSNAYNSTFSRPGWTCIFNNSFTENLTFSAGGSNTTIGSPIQCNKTNVITKGISTWNGYLAGNFSLQMVKKTFTLFNTDSFDYSNVRWEESAPESCWNTSTSILNGTVNTPVNTQVEINAFLKGDCIAETKYNWSQDLSINSTSEIQYIKRDIELTNLTSIILSITYGLDDFDSKPPGSYCSLATPNPTYVDGKTNVTILCSGMYLNVTRSPVEQDKRINSTLSTQWLIQNISVTNSINISFTGIQITFDSFPFTNCTTPPINISSGARANAIKQCSGDAITDNWSGVSEPISAIEVSTTLNPVSTLRLRTNFTVTETSGYSWKNILINISDVIRGANGTKLVNISGYTTNSVLTVDYNIPAPYATESNNTQSGVFTKNINITCNVACDQLKNIKANVSITNGFTDYRLFHNESGVWVDKTSDLTIGNGWASWIIPNLSEHQYKITAVTKPKWFNQSQSADYVKQGNAVNLSVYWTSDAGLQYAWLETNETGIWQRKETKSLGGSGGAWVNFTWNNSSIAAPQTIGWRIIANDSNGENDTNIMTFKIIETIAPIISIFSPENNTYYNTSNITLDYAIIGDVSACSFSIDNNPNVTLSDCSQGTVEITNINDGYHTLTIYASNNINQSSKTIYFGIDTISPGVYYYVAYFSNNTSVLPKYNTKIIWLNLTADEPVGCLYYLNDDINSLTTFNITNTYEELLNDTFIYEGINNITIICSDIAQNIVGESLYFGVDTIPPLINLSAPQGSYHSTSIPIIYTASDANNVSWCGYSLDGGTNTTLTENTTITVSSGSHNIILYCKDTYNNTASASSSFTVTVSSDGGTSGGSGSGGGGSGGWGGGGGGSLGGGSGGGLITPSLTIGISPRYISITEGQTAEVTLTVENNGTAQINNLIISVSGVPSWTASEKSFSLAPGAKKIIYLTFNYSGPGMYNATIKISNADILRTISLPIEIMSKSNNTAVQAQMLIMNASNEIELAKAKGIDTRDYEAALQTAIALFGEKNYTGAIITANNIVTGLAAAKPKPLFDISGLITFASGIGSSNTIIAVAMGIIFVSLLLWKFKKRETW